jgi:hypothetical protein
MMEVENDCIFVSKKIIRWNLFVMKKMTSKDKTLRKIEELRVMFLIVHDIIELFICIKNAFDKCKWLLVVIVQVSDSLHESTALRIKYD